jgi:putative YphP/YqiW family bacilliredoxin
MSINSSLLYLKKKRVMYPEEVVKPMKLELTSNGFKELSNDDDIKNMIENGSSVIMVNSVCGCAAANARPGVISSLNNEKTPNNLFTVFAGVDREATDSARELMFPFPPSSPCIALFKDGELVHMLERHHIEGRDASLISENLKQAYDEFC